MKLRQNIITVLFSWRVKAAQQQLSGRFWRPDNSHLPERRKKGGKQLWLWGGAAVDPRNLSR